jgi:hypothetical protein
MRLKFGRQRLAYLGRRLLSIKMPDGRHFRDWTDTDCDAYADATGAGDPTGNWLRHVARRIRLGWADGNDCFAGKTVGETFSESELGNNFLLSNAQQLADWDLLEQSGRPEVQPGDELTDDEFMDFCAKVAEAFHPKK